MFDLQAGTVQCPFCNTPIPQDLDSGPTDPNVGSPLDPLAPPVPTPGLGATPDPVPLEGTLDPNSPTLHHDEPPPEPSPAAAGAAAAQGGALKVAAIAGGAFLAFKLGLLDGLLGLVGMNSAPPPAVQAPAPAPAEPAPDVPAEPAPALEPGLPPEPAVAPQEAPPAVPAPAPAPAEWRLEGKVSDMLSMKPVKGAVLLFMTPEEDETYEARSDGTGRWQLTLPARKDGYKLVIDHSDYIADYFDETDPPYRTWTQARRRQLRAAKPAHRPWTAVGAEPARRDVLLFPEFTDK